MQNVDHLYQELKVTLDFGSIEIEINTELTDLDSPINLLVDVNIAIGFHKEINLIYL